LIHFYKRAGSGGLKMSPFLFFSLVPLSFAADSPNIVIVLTDDQDVFLDGMTPLQKTQRLIGEQGTTFENAFVNTPICCPSRASFLTGRYMHNTGAFNNSIGGLCGGPEWQEREAVAFAPRLQAAGYQTMYAGKYMNMYGLPGAGGTEQVPVGWDQWVGLVGNSKFYNYTLSRNGVAEKHADNYEEDYLTDLLGREASSFLSSRDPSRPFLMVLAAPASHAPFTPAPQYSEEFSEMEAPRLPSYNHEGTGKHWFLRQPPLSEPALEEVDKVFRDRLRTLLSVDDLVEGVVGMVEQMGEVDNTYFIYTSDHGYHLGEFGLPIDKRQPYEFDIRIPMLMRGPGVPANVTSKSPALMIDLAPTLLHIAGLEDQGIELDGESLLSRNNEQREFLVEYSGEGGEGVDKDCPQWQGGDFSWCKVELDCKCQDTRNNTYTCLRSFNNEAGPSMFCQFEDDENFEEFYNLESDPFQLENLVSVVDEETLMERRLALSELSSCLGASCHGNSRDVTKKKNE